jgi:hypothetical protein
MSMEDGFDPDHPLPRFLAAQPEPDVEQAADRAAPASRAFKAGVVLIATATAIGIAVVATGNPKALFAEGTASLVDHSSPQPTPAIQSAADVPASVSSGADAQALPQTTKDAPGRDEFAASEPAGKDQTENREPAAEALFMQFQAWAAQQDAQPPGQPTQSARVEPVEVVQAPARAVEDTPAPAAENVQAPHRLLHKRRHIPAVRNARAEMRAQNLRQHVRREHVRRTQSGRAERPPVQDARAQEQSVQDAQSPSWLSGFGLRY